MTKILFLGDSLVADHDWQARMPSFKVENFGAPGATAADLLASLPPLKTEATGADVIVVMIGTNDLLNGNDDFLMQLKTILVELSHDHPTAEILVTSLLPMNLTHLPSNTVSSLNTHIEALTMRTGCCYLDLHRRFTGSDKQLFQEDGVHITAAAYAIWERALMEHIAFLVEND
ncbi:MAG: GDSL-type esterase/lipase family protein [Pseudomonadota bacterium]